MKGNGVRRVVQHGLCFALALMSFAVCHGQTNEVVFLCSWGSTGSGPGQFNYLSKIATDGNGCLYAADTWNYRIQKFTTGGTFVGHWGGYGTGDGQFCHPLDVALDNTGFVYVTDYITKKVQKFTTNGTFVSVFTQFNDARRLAFDSQTNCYVADGSVGRVVKFSYDGHPLMQWPAPSYPDGIAIDRNDNVYVALANGNCIQKFTTNGTFLLQWGSTGNGDGQFQSPRNPSVDKDGNVYVADYNNNRIQVFSPDGTFLFKWGETGTGAGQFLGPMSVAFDAEDNIYVGEYDGNRIQVFRQVKPPIAAGVDIAPSVLNRRSNGQWITCFIGLPEGYDVNNIVADQVRLVIGQTSLAPEVSSIENTELILKFDRAVVIQALPPETPTTLCVEGVLTDGTSFQGNDTVRTIGE